MEKWIIDVAMLLGILKHSKNHTVDLTVRGWVLITVGSFIASLFYWFIFELIK